MQQASEVGLTNLHLHVPESRHRTSNRQLRHTTPCKVSWRADCSQICMVDAPCFSLELTALMTTPRECAFRILM